MDDKLLKIKEYISSSIRVKEKIQSSNVLTEEILKISELFKKNFPINEAVEPNIIKTTEKPKVKKIVLIIIKFFFLSFILSSEVPEI